ncbi:MAG: Orotidine 5'-phosphate decarboxylase [Owenweeksia sp. TMED14]|nr:MAG: Orotidine 5'-phosphate decarboxylase [Owenweeksia sp. TMED14]|tara:strand:- start:145 stop:966 length:822 start_codon:yes stop_codon:yes gene_type:complete
MTRAELIKNIENKKSVLCVGLDPDLTKMPSLFPSNSNGVVEFCKGIIDATADYAVAYKPNLAFFESLGESGWEALAKVADHLKDYPQHFSIADAKRGDIGNTAKMYAEGILVKLGFDSITVAPYMGKDSIEPFSILGKWGIALGLTSNPGAQDFQMKKMEDDRYLYEHVLDAYKEWISPENWMIVVGATREVSMRKIRHQLPEYFFLVPGVGHQGGTIKHVMDSGVFTSGIGVGVLINASRSICYASSDKNYASAAAKEASRLHEEMKYYWPQ